MYTSLSGLIGALLPIFVSCAAGAGRSECPEVRQPSAAPASSAMPASTSSASAPLPVMTSPIAPNTPAPVSPPVSEPVPTAAAGQSLPELKVQLAGMHIGGGPNDDVSKRPFVQAIEGSFESMRVCYKKAEEPTRGGTFGVDLKIGHNGGKAELQQIRTALKGDGLRECLEKAFKEISFGPPPKGPTIVSVSVRFSLAE